MIITSTARKKKKDIISRYIFLGFWALSVRLHIRDLKHFDTFKH